MFRNTCEARVKMSVIKIHERPFAIVHELNIENEFEEISREPETVKSDQDFEKVHSEDGNDFNVSVLDRAQIVSQ